MHNELKQRDSSQDSKDEENSNNNNANIDKEGASKAAHLDHHHRNFILTHPFRQRFNHLKIAKSKEDKEDEDNVRISKGK
jgi:hypothetical protein